MNIPRTQEAADNAIRILLHSGKTETPKSWQAIDCPATMKEVSDIFIKMQMVNNKEELAAQTKADLPWAEDHFIERLSGPSNPGEQYKHWPFYKGTNNDELFRSTGKFSHTYQERFWPPEKKGIRFKMGSLADIRQRLREDQTTRQAFLSIWHPEDQSNNGVRVPCTIGYWFKISNGVLNLSYLIRSCDAARHFRNDIYMAQRLAQDMVRYVGDLELGTLSMWIGSFHCFESDIYHLTKKLNNG